MNRATRIILILIVILLVLAGLGWLGYDNYQQSQQLDELEEYQTTTENEGQKRYEEKLAFLQEKMQQLNDDVAQTLEQVDRGSFFSENPAGLKERLQGISASLQQNSGALDSAYYGSESITEENLIAFEQQMVDHLEAMRKVDQEDSRIAKAKMKRYRSQLNAYREKMRTYLNEKKALEAQLEELQQQMAQSNSKNATLQQERDQLLQMLEGKDVLINDLSSDTTSYAQSLRAIEDSLSMIEGRDLPAQIYDMRCYYVPRDHDGRGQVWLNEQPIHTGNKVRDVYVEFKARVWNASDQSKMEVVLRHNGVPIRSLDVITSNGEGSCSFDCGKAKLLVGDYEVQVKYMGEVIRTHKFKISKFKLL